MEFSGQANTMKRFISLSIILILLGAAPGLALEDDARDSEPQRRFGLVVGVPQLRVAEGTYQTGLGAVVRYPGFAVRGLASFGYQTAGRGTQTGLQLGYQGFLADGPVVPYWAAIAGAGFERERIGVDADNHAVFAVLNADAGGAFGVEVSVLDYLSFFAEYQLAVGFRRRWVVRKVEGSVTEVSDSDFIIEARPGNTGAIGVVFYLPPLPWTR